MAPKHRRIQFIKTKEDFCANVPPEIMIDILSRLPIPTVLRCKCVCKSWLNLVQSLEFAKSLSKSVRPLTLALFRAGKRSKPYRILELVDTQNPRHRYNVVFKFNFEFPHRKLLLHSSADGLLLLFNKYDEGPLNLFICNPLTREYIKLPPLSRRPSSSLLHQETVFGFGVSKLTGKYKMLRMLHSSDVNHLTDSCKCEVYTLGTGSWRSLAAGGPLWYNDLSSSVFLNGNLHWLVRDFEQGDSFERISYFDLETECFSIFSVPDHGYSTPCLRSMCALGDSLCLCDNVFNHVSAIWLMKKYGDENSWRKEFVIKIHLGRSPDRLIAPIVPIKMFKNGDILLAHERCHKLFCYSSKTKTIREVDHTKGFANIGFKPSIYIPSFLPLQIFAMENVSSF